MSILGKEEVEGKEFKEDKKTFVPSRLRLDHSMLYCPDHFFKKISVLKLKLKMIC
jgi:hypothetical protein